MFFRYILYVGASDQAENEGQRRSSMAVVEIRLQGALKEQTKNIVNRNTPTPKPKSSSGSNRLISQSTPFVQPKPTKSTSLFTPVQKVITVSRPSPTASTLSPTVSSKHYVVLNRPKSGQNHSPVLQQQQPTQPTQQRVNIYGIL